MVARLILVLASLLVSILIFPKISYGAVRFPKSAVCLGGLTSDKILVTFSQPAFDRKLSDASNNSSGNYEPFATCDGVLTPGTNWTMTTPKHAYVAHYNHFSFRGSSACFDSDLKSIDFIEVTFVNQEVPGHHVTMHLDGQNRLTLEAGSKKEMFDCTVTEQF